MQLDISKAFDKISWPFIFKSLAFFNLSEKWISLINQCVSSSKGSVLINRTPCGFFLIKLWAKARGLSIPLLIHSRGRNPKLKHPKLDC